MTDSYEAHPSEEIQQDNHGPVPDEISPAEVILDDTEAIFPQAQELKPIYATPESFTTAYGFKKHAQPLGSYQLLTLKELAKTTDEVEISDLTENIKQLYHRPTRGKDTIKTVERFAQRGLVDFDSETSRVKFTERGAQCFVDYQACYGEISDEVQEQFQRNSAYHIAEAIALTLQNEYGEDVDIEDVDLTEWVAAPNKKIDVIGWLAQETGMAEKTVRNNLTRMSQGDKPYIELQAHVVNNQSKPTNICLTPDGVEMFEKTTAKLIESGRILDPKTVWMTSEILSGCITLARELDRDELVERLNNKGGENGSVIPGMSKAEFRDFSTEVAELRENLMLERVAERINTRAEMCIDLATRLGKDDLVQKLTDERVAREESREEFGMPKSVIREYATYLVELASQLSSELETEHATSDAIHPQVGQVALRQAS